MNRMHVSRWLSRIRGFARLATHVQLLPLLEGGEELLVGGQAVIEGVMMRAPHSYCVAVRRPDGSIARDEAPIQRPAERRRIFRYPIFRGLGTLGQAMALGIRALRFSSNVSLEQQVCKSGQKPIQISRGMLAANVIFSVAFFIFLYKVVPLFLATEIQNRWSLLGGSFAFNLADGFIRIAIFLLFLGLVSRLKDIRRVFQYHGSEHKVVFNFESGRPVELAEARTFSTLHPRCGTSFLLVVMVVSLILYALLPFDGFVTRLIARLALLPVIVGASYEVIRFAARRQGTLWALLTEPGLWLQKVTTRPPSDDQLEISIAALEGAMALEKQQGGELVIA